MATELLEFLEHYHLLKECETKHLKNWNVLWSLKLCRFDLLLTQYLVPPHPEDEEGGAGKFQASNYGLIFLVTSPHPGTHQESLH